MPTVLVESRNREIIIPFDSTIQMLFVVIAAVAAAAVATAALHFSYSRI